MTPPGLDLIGSLAVSFAPILTVAAGAVYFFVSRADTRRKEALAKSAPPPAVGVVVDDDHADEAINAWKERALGAEQRAGRAEQRADRLEEELETVRLALTARTRELQALKNL